MNIKDRIVALADKAEVIKNSQDEMTNEKRTEIKNILTEITQLEADEKLFASVDSLSNSAGRKVEASTPRIEVVETQIEKASGGFKNFGDFLLSVKNAANGQHDNRLYNAPGTVGTGGTTADGGAAVPKPFADMIVDRLNSPESLLSRCDSMTTSANTMTIPVDNDPVYAATGGIRANWTNEAADITASKPKLTEKVVQLHKLAALVNVSDELLADSRTIESYISRKAGDAIVNSVNAAIISGSGSGQPEGFLNSSSLVTVAKETGQTADTVNFANIRKMYGRMYAPHRANAVWIANQSVEDQLYTMSFEGTSSSVPVYLPANGVSGQPYSTLFGRPIIFDVNSSVVGDAGDISFVNLNQYLALIRGDVQSDSSIHVHFDSGNVAYRFVMRVGGESWMASVITPPNSAPTLSSFVNLAARA